MKGGIAVAVIVLSLTYAAALSWIAEDAYISFRYARNLAEGNGLVFNPGERVEGYTNFLWTILLAGGLSLKLSPLTIGTVLGILFSSLSLLLMYRMHRQVFPDALFPAAILTLGLNYSWACFSTSGLETSLLAFLLLATFTFLSEPYSQNRMMFSGICLGLAMMTRPDAALAGPVIFVYLLAQKRPARETLMFLLFTFLIYSPYFLWRSWYYGDFFPNTFYAKSASGTYYRQGLIYLWKFLHRYFLWILLPLPLMRIRRAPALFVFFVVFICLHSYYVVRIGGDFMEGRFFIPVLAFLYLLVEWGIRSLVRHRIWLTAALAGMVLTTAVDRELIPPRRIVNGITDERTWQPVTESWYAEGATLAKYLPPSTVIATDAVGAFGYASRFPMIDTLGLTDRYVASLPVQKRSRPGHEKVAPLEYLLRRNTSVIRDGIGIYRNLGNPDAVVGSNRYYLLNKDPEFIRKFRQAVQELNR